MTRDTAPALPERVIEQAIDWQVKLAYNTVDAASHAAFERWLDEHDDHARAWQRIQNLTARFAGMPPQLALQTLRKLPEARLQRRTMLKLLSLFVIVGAGSWGAAGSAPWQRLNADYSTRVGERRQWRLSDDSLIDLNTDTAVALRYDANQRLIELLRGEIHLLSGSDSASASKRPLRVATPFGLFEALGTRFSVRLEDDGARLALLEGAVRLHPAQGGEDAIARAGESWRLDARQARRLNTPPSEAAAWRDGLLMARNQPLHEVLAELARYRHGYLGCDPRIANLPVSGNFQLDDPDATLDFIAQAHRLHLQRLTRYWVRLLPV
ncbi:FecR domain-containing protein [Pseudomonas japonica]|uniref:FecR family protein n=1 Tax=Pseudomonas japonica TaxID=256466 RepID=A0A239KCR8_9PSED|nr:FecR domain-containing protein [Pseudomonas japonica]SNT15921.1 FecR family protein [Pseudomonas japonica]